ncbi:hypothetical protein V6N13_065341 [Hibiscus sabdariffa]
MTRNNPGELVKFEPEIEAHARKLNAKTCRERRNQQQELILDTNSDTDVNSDTHSGSDINEPMAEEDQAIQQLAAAPAEQHPLCITFLNGQTPFELKPGFFPAAKASELRRSILGIRQKDNESLYDYWERFKKLCASCPQHGLTEQTLLQYFYEGLLPLEMKMIDAASGGTLVNMTPTAARNLISTMAANS